MQSMAIRHSIRRWNLKRGAFQSQNCSILGTKKGGVEATSWVKRVRSSSRVDPMQTTLSMGMLGTQSARIPAFRPPPPPYYNVSS